MSTASREEYPRAGPAAVEAVGSPARLEILSALGDGPRTTRELACRLGRTRQSLYYHLGLLEDAGLVAAESVAGRPRERRYRVVEERIAVAARRSSVAGREAAAKAIGAILRLTGREAAAALKDPTVRSAGPLRELVGFRCKARLDEVGLGRVNALIDELETLLRSRESGATDVPLYALTLVLTPAREAADPRSGSGVDV
ncbi:MAG: winged helix-turn-helix domain-containing protein [Gemmatimonadota bacterium]